MQSCKVYLKITRHLFLILGYHSTFFPQLPNLNLGFVLNYDYDDRVIVHEKKKFFIEAKIGPDA